MIDTFLGEITCGSNVTEKYRFFMHISLLETPNLNSIICPLTPQYILMLMKGNENSLGNVNIRLVNNDLIKKLNRIILCHANNAIISNYKHLGYLL